MMERIPEPRISPSPEPIFVATCPECGCDEIGLVEYQIVYKRVESWRDGEPKRTSEEDRRFDHYASPKYYCCYCGARFNQVRWVEL